MAKGSAGKGRRKRHRVERTSNATGGPAGLAGRQARRNSAAQLRAEKKTAALAAKRAASGVEGAPKVIALVLAGENAGGPALVKALLAHSSSSDRGATVVGSKARLTLLQPARRVDAVLDAMKAADVMMLVIPADGGLDQLGEHLVDAVCMQGVPAVVGVLTGAELLPQKLQSASRKEWANSLTTRFPEHSKFFSFDLDPKCEHLYRHLSSVTPKQLAWRHTRAYVLAHNYSLEPLDPAAATAAATTTSAAATTGAAAGAAVVSAAAEAHAEGAASDASAAFGVSAAEPKAKLRVRGYVRGAALSAERLVHVPGLGDFAPQRVTVLRDPHEISRKLAISRDEMCIDASAQPEERVLRRNKLMDFEYEAEADELANEQTWPSNDELAAAERRRAGRSQGAKTVSAGEEYAAGWEPSDDDADDGEDGEGDGEDMEEQEEAEEIGVAGSAADDDDDHQGSDAMDAEALGEAEEEAARMELLRMRTHRDEDARFPDEVDTPLDQPARTRFARYRGLKSMRTSPWHPQENLPLEYAKIYQFENWPAIQREVLHTQAIEADEETEAAQGSFVEVELWVPLAFSELFGIGGDIDADADAAATAEADTGGTLQGRNALLVLSSVNTHENRLSVVHFTISLTAEAEREEITLASKQPLILHCGFKRLLVRPIFSEDNRRSTKHKLERFVQPNRQSVASVYAPAIFAPAPVLAFLPESAAPLALRNVPVASGSLLGVDANRIILKKIVLTGHPFRCHKKKAVVRWMFFNPEDVRWFKPVELSTKFGRKGHIRMPLGTHGYMKCYFDGTMVQHDTVCMNLYKRAFPKWGTSTYRLV